MRGEHLHDAATLLAAQAYPRLRGEHTFSTDGDASVLGLPPLARGAPDFLRRPDGLSRPTPACAGSTAGRRYRHRLWRAYPRLRGEHRNSQALGQILEGLPPLARGAPSRRGQSVGSSRPTPACAGSTTTPSPPRTPARAYPRLRGEHEEVTATAKTLSGLPPLARGAPRLDGLWWQRHGPTPACAGSTRHRAPTRRRRRAYPRLRGEHPPAGLERPLVPGLPPLARGAPSVTCWFRRVSWPLGAL